MIFAKPLPLAVRAWEDLPSYFPGWYVQAKIDGVRCVLRDGEIQSPKGQVYGKHPRLPGVRLLGEWLPAKRVVYWWDEVSTKNFADRLAVIERTGSHVPTAKIEDIVQFVRLVRGPAWREFVEGVVIKAPGRPAASGARWENQRKIRWADSPEAG